MALCRYVSKPQPPPLRGPQNKQLEKELFGTGTNTGINFDKYDEIPVQVSRGTKRYDHVEEFSQFALHQWLMENVIQSGYRKPTPVQKYAIPALLDDRDVMACAQTGCGKTAAYLIPIVNNILTKGPRQFRGGIRDWTVVHDRHSRSEHLARNSVTECRGGNKWMVASGTDPETRGPYTVSINNRWCSCVVRCRVCGVCDQMYSCTCEDHHYRQVACKHIHLVHQMFGVVQVYPLVLILAPTRELAQQIQLESRKFNYRLPMVTAILNGGKGTFHTQIDALESGCDILVATPGRLLSAIKNGHVNLQECRYLVLDEADRMLDMGFEPQIRQVEEHMLHKGEKQTIMLSATFPRAIQELARDFLENFVFFTVGRIGSTTEKNIIQKIIKLDEADKQPLLCEMLDRLPKGLLTLVFLETKNRTSSLAKYLQTLGYDVVTLQGNMQQHEREQSLNAFKKGIAPILCATNVAARGLDIPNVHHVINYDLPSDIDQYVHRIGRTGRIGNQGVATSFFTDKNWNIAPELANLMVEAQQELPKWIQRYATIGAKTSGTSYFTVRSAITARPYENEWGEREL